MLKVNETLKTAEMEFICRAAVACRCSCHGWKEQVHGRHRTVRPAAIFVTSHLARIAVVASEFILLSYSQLLAGTEGTFCFHRPCERNS